MRIYPVIALALALLAGLACGNADEARQEGYDQGVREGRQTAQAYQRTLYDLPTSTPSSGTADATSMHRATSTVPTVDSAAPTADDHLALDACIDSAFGSYSLTSSSYRPAFFMLARYHSLSGPEQQVMRRLVRNASDNTWVDCQDWIGSEADFTAKTGYDHLALEACFDRMFGSGSLSATGADGFFMLARYHSLSPPEQQVMRHLVRNSGEGYFLACYGWLGSERNAS